MRPYPSSIYIPKLDTLPGRISPFLNWLATLVSKLAQLVFLPINYLNTVARSKLISVRKVPPRTAVYILVFIIKIWSFENAVLSKKIEESFVDSPKESHSHFKYVRINYAYLKRWCLADKYFLNLYLKCLNVYPLIFIYFEN